MEIIGGITMTNWKLTTIILAILLGISLMWSVQQRANFEKNQLRTYVLQHGSLNHTLKTTIEAYEQGGSQKELGEQLLLMYGYLSNGYPYWDTTAYHMSDFDDGIRRVLYVVHRKARGNVATQQDIDRLKDLQLLTQRFRDTTGNNLERKTVDDFESEFIEFMAYYETQKEYLFK